MTVMSATKRMYEYSPELSVVVRWIDAQTKRVNEVAKEISDELPKRNCCGCSSPEYQDEKNRVRLKRFLIEKMEPYDEFCQIYRINQAYVAQKGLVTLSEREQEVQMNQPLSNDIKDLHQDFQRNLKELQRSALYIDRAADTFFSSLRKYHAIIEQGLANLYDYSEEVVSLPWYSRLCRSFEHKAVSPHFFHETTYQPVKEGMEKEDHFSSSDFPHFQHAYDTEVDKKALKELNPPELPNVVADLKALYSAEIAQCKNGKED